MLTMRTVGLCVLCLAWIAGPAFALTPILTPGDPILAIDLDGLVSNSSYPGGEPPPAILDNDSATKYLNFGGAGSGFIVTLDEGASAVRSFQMTTANDSPGRDPLTWALYGTNEPIVSTDNSAGLDEPWTLLGTGDANLSDDRFSVGPLTAVANDAAYASYKMLYPTVKGDPLFQLADVQFFVTSDGFSPLLSVDGEGGSILAVNQSLNSRYPGGEAPPMVIDNDTGTKYLNFGRENSGFIVTPQGDNAGLPVRSFAVTTANDAAERDPATWEVYGTNDPISSADNSDGSAEAWTLLASGDFNDRQMPAERTVQGSPVRVLNDDVFASYRMVFPSTRGDGNSMQLAEIQFYTESVPEPASAWLALIALAGWAGWRRRSV